ncbi:MAG: hypothetical protein MI921_18180, partial [Cytophagales bacterium]|nr:hypothetical protein [Cytophagales bacterium]
MRCSKVLLTGIVQSDPVKRFFKTIILFKLFKSKTEASYGDHYCAVQSQRRHRTRRLRGVGQVDGSSRGQGAEVGREGDSSGRAGGD